MWFFNKSNNKLTTILLLLLTFLLTTKMPTTNTTITMTTITTTATLMATAKTTTITSLESRKNTSEKRIRKQKEEEPEVEEEEEEEEEEQEQFYEYLAKADTTRPLNFDVRLRGTLPLHKDNFIASLVNGNRNSHGVADVKSSFQHHMHNKSINSDIYKNKIISHTQYFNSFDPIDYNSIDINAERGKSLLPLVPITTPTTTTTTKTTIAKAITTYPPPFFDFGVPRNITARAGQIASITCRVENLGDKSVSWIRKRDLHILTAGMLTYTSDERFKVLRTADSRSWSLHVKYAQPRDSGVYECQVNTEPKISMAFRLKVIVTPPDAKAIITGPTDLYVKVGSKITLTCHVKQSSSAHDIGRIYWYRGPYVLTPFEIHSNDAAIDLQRISMESKLVEHLQSRLRIANAQTIDSGNYTCMPTTAEAASVTVNVINDESPAAMQKSSSTTTNNFSKIQWYLLNIIFCIYNY